MNVQYVEPACLGLYAFGGAGGAKKQIVAPFSVLGKMQSLIHVLGNPYL